MRSSANDKLSSKVGEGKQKRAEFGGFSGLLTKLLEPLCVSPEPSEAFPNVHNIRIRAYVAEKKTWNAFSNRCCRRDLFLQIVGVHCAVRIVDGVAGVHLRLPLLDLVHRRRLGLDAIRSLDHIRVVDSFSKIFRSEYYVLDFQNFSLSYDNENEIHWKLFRK